jgi:hypothetical protein
LNKGVTGNTSAKGIVFTGGTGKADGRAERRRRIQAVIGSILVGGTEAGWSYRQGCWILHVHLLAISVREQAWEQLRAALGDSGSAIPLKVQPLRDVEYQLSYVLKFVTCFWPSRFGPEGRGEGRPFHQNFSCRRPSHA